MVEVGIITPVKNESDNLPDLIESVVNQDLQPAIWCIVDDGSTDGSKELIESAANSYDWITQVSTDSNEGYRMRENYANVLQIGYNHLIKSYPADLDYYMILDGDMKLECEYISSLVDYIEEKDGVVIASGGIYLRREEDLVLENRYDDRPAGGATLYDGRFYREIGGPPVVPGVDCGTAAKARIRGLQCKHLPRVKAIQSRPTGTKGDLGRNAMMRGANYYSLGIHPGLIILNTLTRVVKPPFYHGLAFLLGYLLGVAGRYERTTDKEILKYNRHHYHKDLFTSIIQEYI